MHVARRSKCMLTKSLETTLGLDRALTFSSLDEAWEDVDALQSGTITEASHCFFFVIKVFINKREFRNVCVMPKSRSFECEGKERRRQGYECDLAVELTHHELQAKILGSKMPSFKSIRGVLREKFSITPSSCSRCIIMLSLEFYLFKGS